MQVIYEGVGWSQGRAIPWRSKLVLTWGKMRRAYLTYVRPRYVQRSLERRVGACHRTGACCHLAFSCPLLHWLERTPFCRIYRRRPGNCTTFPIDERDLRDRNIINPWEPCGFSFLSPGEAEKVEHSVPTDAGTET